jgi:hypothetical protein
MIAFQRPFDALRFAAHVQERLVDADGSDAVLSDPWTREEGSSADCGPRSVRRLGAMGDRHRALEVFEGIDSALRDLGHDEHSRVGSELRKALAELDRPASTAAAAPSRQEPDGAA